MGNFLSGASLYDFFSYLTPGLFLYSAIVYLVAPQYLKFDTSYSTIMVVIISYILGRIMKAIFEEVMDFECGRTFPIRDFYYRLNDGKDKKNSSKLMFKEVDVNELQAHGVIIKIKYFKDFSYKYKYSYDYDNCTESGRPYLKRILIEQAASILKQNNIEGDYTMYQHLKYFFQLMSCACYLITIVYIGFFIFKNNAIQEFCKYINEIYTNKCMTINIDICMIIRILLYIIFSIIILPFILCYGYKKLKDIKTKDIKTKDIRELLKRVKDYKEKLLFFWVPVILALVIVIYFTMHEQIMQEYINWLICFLSSCGFFIFRELFISSYKSYLSDVVNNFIIYSSSSKKYN